jgi:hypothetical protein
MALTKVTNSMLVGAPINVLDFGADNTGATDASTSLQAAFDAAAVAGGKVIIPPGQYKLSSGISINGDTSVEGYGVGATVLIADAGVLEAVSFGTSSILTGKISDLTVQRAAYSGATENIGFAFYDCAGAMFVNIESRFSKYNFFMKPQNGQRVAYSMFSNIQGVGGLYNISGTLVGSTGYCNELVFYGGRMFTTSDTDTNVYIPWNANHLRFSEMSCEGSGTQAFYLNGTSAGGTHSITVENCRTEGTWSADDVVLGANTQRCLIVGVNLYTTVTDNGLGNNYILAGGSTFNSDVSASVFNVKRTGAAVGTPAMRIIDAYSSSGDSYGLEIQSARDTAGGFIIKAFRTSDGLVRFSVGSTGELFTGISLAAGQSAWNYNPLRLGSYTLWVDATGDLRIKNGTPTSDTDGTVVGTQT